MRSKHLVAFRPDVLDELDRYLSGAHPIHPLVHDALVAIRNAKALYAGEAPGIRLAEPGELTRKDG